MILLLPLSSLYAELNNVFCAFRNWINSRVYQNSFCITASMNVNSVSGCYQSFPSRSVTELVWDGRESVMGFCTNIFVEYIIYYFARKNWDGGRRRKMPYLCFPKQWKNRGVLQCTNVHTCFYSFHILSRPLKHAQCQQDTFESPVTHVV